LRIQCELAKPEGDRARRHQLGVQMRQILERHEPAWLAPFGAVAKNREYRRGLLRVIIPDDDIGLPDLERLAASEEWAWVQRVRLPLFAFDQLFRRAALPLLSNLSELAVTCRTGSNSWWARFVEFLSQPDRAMLSSLEVFGGVITTAALATLS